jgi:hypothetical protein
MPSSLILATSSSDRFVRRKLGRRKPMQQMLKDEERPLYELVHLRSRSQRDECPDGRAAKRGKPKKR